MTIMGHKYFEQNKPERWSILDFLNKCSIEPFDLKIDCYIKCLETIYTSEQGGRRKSARVLLDRYRMSPQPDRKKAKDWDEKRSHSQIHIHQPINGDGNFMIGNVNTKVFVAKPFSEKREEVQDNNKVSKRVKVREFISQQEQGHQPQTSEDQTGTTRESSPPSIISTTSIHSLYIPSSSNFSSDEEFIKSGKKTFRLSYFVGPGVLEWHLNKDSIRWIINNVDLSEICHKYRMEVIENCKSMTVVLDAFEELALNHVFVFQEESPCGLCEYIDGELWEDIFVEFQKLYSYSSIPDRIYDLFTSIIKIACEIQNRGERQEAARSCLDDFDATTNEERVIVEIFKDLIENEQSSFVRNNTIEDTHIIQNITPIIIRPFFKNNRKINFEGANKMSESSAIALRRFDPVLFGKKPDFVVKTTNPKTHIELLIGEIKPPVKRGALISDDLVSLGKTMKCALDKSINDGIDDLVICGLQIIGFLGRGYVMDLQYHGIYRLILIGEFELPKSSTSWGTILKCYQILNTIQLIVNDGASRYQSAIRMNSKRMESDKMKMIKSMFHSPIKIPLQS